MPEGQRERKKVVPVSTGPTGSDCCQVHLKSHPRVHNSIEGSWDVHTLYSTRLTHRVWRGLFLTRIDERINHGSKHTIHQTKLPPLQLVITMQHNVLGGNSGNFSGPQMGVCVSK